MKLINFHKIPKPAQNRVDFLLGCYKGSPLWVAKKRSVHEWTLYQNVGQEGLRKNNLKKIGNLTSMQDILAFFQVKGLKPLCPQPESFPAMDSSVGGSSVRDTERRRYFRKKANLKGQYYKLPNGRSRDLLTEDVSFMGLRFVPVDEHNIQAGDKLYLTFTLDNSKMSRIKRQGQVRYVNGEQIGIEFINPPTYDKELGFYLMYNI